MKRANLNKKSLISTSRYNVSLQKILQHFLNDLKLGVSFWSTTRPHGTPENLSIVKELNVVNDTAERSVKFMEEFTSILTKKEVSE